jgi:hypothetical protein
LERRVEAARFGKRKTYFTPRARLVLVPELLVRALAAAPFLAATLAPCALRLARAETFGLTCAAAAA